MLANSINKKLSYVIKEMYSFIQFRRQYLEKYSHSKEGILSNNNQEIIHQQQPHPSSHHVYTKFIL
jgi:hypothetical protein